MKITSDSLKVEANQLLLNEVQVYVSPFKPIREVAFWEDKGDQSIENALLLTGYCCDGHVAFSKVSEDKFVLADIVSVDLVPQDVLPLEMDYEKTGFCNEGALLVVGQGCAGSGLRLLDTGYHGSRMLVGRGGYRSLQPARDCDPRLRLDVVERRIFLDFHVKGWRPKKGFENHPDAYSPLRPNLKVEEPYVWHVPYESCDITDILLPLGLMLEETISKLEGFRRVYFPS